MNFDQISFAVKGDQVIFLECKRRNNPGLNRLVSRNLLAAETDLTYKAIPCEQRAKNPEKQYELCTIAYNVQVKILLI